MSVESSNPVWQITYGKDAAACRRCLDEAVRKVMDKHWAPRGTITEHPELALSWALFRAADIRDEYRRLTAWRGGTCYADLA